MQASALDNYESNMSSSLVSNITNTVGNKLVLSRPASDKDTFSQYFNLFYIIKCQYYNGRLMVNKTGKWQITIPEATEMYQYI